jgi:hypothetical protein
MESEYMDDEEMMDENLYRLRMALIVGAVVLLVAVAVCATVVLTKAVAVRRDERVRVACVTSGGDYYPQEGGKCVHARP